MIAKCANPTCGRPFLYLHDGKLFAVEVHDQETAENKGGVGFGSPPYKTQYFWICNDCWRRAGGTVLSTGELIRGLPKPPQRYRANTVVVIEDPFGTKTA